MTAFFSIAALLTLLLGVSGLFFPAARTSPPSAARAAILAGGLVVSAVMAALGLFGVFSGTVGLRLERGGRRAAVGGGVRLLLSRRRPCRLTPRHLPVAGPMRPSAEGRPR